MHVVRQGNGTFQVIWLQQNAACTCLTIATHLCMKASVSQNKHLLSSFKSPRFELTIAQNINSLTADAFTIKSERDIPFKKSKGVWKDQSPLKKRKDEVARTGKERLYDYYTLGRRFFIGCPLHARFSWDRFWFGSRVGGGATIWRNEVTPLNVRIRLVTSTEKYAWVFC